jgi:hypothetical protein
MLGQSALTMSMWFKRAASNSLVQVGQEQTDRGAMKLP